MKSILTHIVSGVIILIFSYFIFSHNQQKIFVADFDKVRKSIVANIVTDKNYQYQAEDKLISQRINNFESAVEKLSKRENAIIIDKRAVLGSSKKDVTAELEQLVNDIN